MKTSKTTLFPLLISIFIFGNCKGDSSNDNANDYNTEETIDAPDEETDEPPDENTNGTLLAEASFEGTMHPFKTEHDGADIHTDPTAPDGAQVLRFTYPPGHPSGYSPDLAWVWFEQGSYEVKAEYHFKYSNNFYFHRIDNKQVYLDIGDQTNFFLSAVDTNYIGGVGINTELNFVCQYGNIGSAIRATPNMSQVAISPNIWYKVTLYFKLNTDSHPNGLLKIWLNDKPIMDYTDIVFNTGSEANKPFTCLKFDPVWGGAGDPKPESTDYFYIDAVKIWSGPFTKSLP